MNFQTYKNFLSSTETETLIDDVMDMKDFWYKAQPELQVGLEGGLYVLGNCIYLRKNICKLNRVISNKFSWVHHKIARKLEEITGTETVLSECLPPPGFHISTLRIEASEYLHFHTDNTIKEYVPNVDLRKVYSMLILLEAPDAGAYLETLEKMYQYEVGALHIWRGGVEKHRMSGLKCEEGEHRITLQCHSYYDEQQQKNVIYF